MRTILMLVTAVGTVLTAQAQYPDITGVWKADLKQSKIPGPPLKDYLEIIEQKTVVLDRRTQEKGPEIDETTGIWGQHGEERSVLMFVPNGKPYVKPFQGIPTEITASGEGNTMKVLAEVAGVPTKMERTYKLSSDGNTLTIDSLTTINGKEQSSTIVLSKQPDSAAEPLRQPEELAGTHFKNVTTSLKTLPTSEFIDNMRYFAWSLGKNCEFCHVKGQFDSDDKKEKKTARDMIKMVVAIDADNFKNHPAVRCFTCHEQHSHPLTHPLFPDELARLQAAQNAGPDAPMKGAGSGPQGQKPGDMPPPKPQQ